MGAYLAEAVGMILGLIAMALLYGFLDPGFGLNSASIPTFGGLLIGVVITTVGFAVPTLVLRRARTKERGRLESPSGRTVVGLGCVLISRLIGFLPGYLYGVALGLVFAAEVGDEVAAKEVTTTSVVVLAIAFTAWFGLGAVRSADTGGLSDLVQASPRHDHSVSLRSPGVRACCRSMACRAGSCSNSVGGFGW